MKVAKVFAISRYMKRLFRTIASWVDPDTSQVQRRTAASHGQCLEHLHAILLGRLIRKPWISVAVLAISFIISGLLWHSAVQDVARPSRNFSGENQEKPIPVVLRRRAIKTKHTAPGSHAFTPKAYQGQENQPQISTGTDGVHTIPKNLAAFDLALITAAVGSVVVGIHSFRVAAIVMLALPFSLAGSLLGFSLGGGGALPYESMACLSAVLGFSACNSILLVSRYHELEPADRFIGSRGILKGAKERLMLIGVTSVLAALFLIPWILSGATTHTASALMTLGGLVTTALLNLFLLPSLYARFAHTPYWKQILKSHS